MAVWYARPNTFGQKVHVYDWTFETEACYDFNNDRPYIACKFSYKNGLGWNTRFNDNSNSERIQEIIRIISRYERSQNEKRVRERRLPGA